MSDPIAQSFHEGVFRHKIQELTGVSADDFHAALDAITGWVDGGGHAPNELRGLTDAGIRKFEGSSWPTRFVARKYVQHKLNDPTFIDHAAKTLDEMARSDEATAQQRSQMLRDPQSLAANPDSAAILAEATRRSKAFRTIIPYFNDPQKRSLLINALDDDVTPKRVMDAKNLNQLLSPQ